MRHQAAPAVVFAALLLALQAAPFACGDKFLMPLRGTRFVSPPDRVHAAVLVYADPSSPLPGVLARLAVNDHLRRVGYRATIVTTPAAFEAAMSLGGWDIIVADIADGEAIRGRGDIGRAAIVPVTWLSVKSAPEFAARYARVIKKPSNSDAFVEAIDETLMSRRPFAKPAPQHR